MQFFAFLGTKQGRWFRGIFGVALIFSGAVALRGILRIALVAFGMVEVAGSVLNLCALAPLFGGHFRAGRNVEEYGGERYRVGD